ncbi:MAG: hypothetical protein H0X30_24645 [Anaerolineae bacterium]|nr:hypothetical protein [Anaerolineae bacterium]
MMQLGILFLVMFIAAFFIVFRYIMSLRDPVAIQPFNPATIDWDAIGDDIIQDELAKGNKIAAIKHYRLLTGQGLKEAKNAIDYVLHHPDEHGKKKKAAYDAQDAGIRDLIEAGRLDEAVEIYQKFAGVDAYTARDAVDEIARDIHLNDQTASRTTFEVPPIDKTSQN